MWLKNFRRQTVVYLGGMLLFVVGAKWMSSTSYAPQFAKHLRDGNFKAQLDTLRKLKEYEDSAAAKAKTAKQTSASK